jgi:hypothetical protein
MNGMTKLLEFLCRLEKNKIYYRIEHNRDEAIMIIVDVPGQKWEVEFFADSTVEIETFKSDGIIQDESELERFFTKFSD